ncbi:MAG: DUF2249 domain-containing protein [Planctomycetota bacterium]|nr:DUF2249 domain-containing protein [Planctomycetota bacterium]
MTTIPVLDGREIPPETRLQEIMSRLTALAPGESLVLVAPHDPGKLLRMLLAQLPNRLMWGPLAKGPDAWRWQFVGREPAPRTVCDYLIWDHRRMEEILADALALAQAGNWQEAQARFAEHAVALTHHAFIEDEVLFPAYDEATGNLPDGPTALMMQEHHDVRAGIERIARAAKQRDLEELEDAHDALVDVAAEHHAKEEEILFPGIDETFPQPQLAELVEKLMLA